MVLKEKFLVFWTLSPLSGLSRMKLSGWHRNVDYWSCLGVFGSFWIAPKVFPVAPLQSCKIYFLQWMNDCIKGRFRYFGIAATCVYQRVLKTTINVCFQKCATHRVASAVRWCSKSSIVVKYSFCRVLLQIYHMQSNTTETVFRHDT